MEKDDQISILSPPQFPHLLSHIHRPPKHFFMRGKAFWLEPEFDDYTYICIVGSRRYTEYGKMACRHLIRSLAGHKVIIVSGLAVGIDGIAHQAALDVGLPTIAFPGSGLDWSVLYPSHNIGLAHNILNAGSALLSEFPCDLRGAQWTFPTRNRTMAGISHVTVVIEAEEKSGALITARHALEFSRETYAVPGSIFSYASAGTNKILGEWAHPITSVEQFIEDVKIKKRDAYIF